MIIELNVSDLRITYECAVRIPAQNINTIKVHFNMDSSWDKLNIAVIFKNVPDDGTEEIKKTCDYENYLIIPPQVLNKVGRLYITLYGTDSKTVARTIKLERPIRVLSCGDNPGGDTPNIDDPNDKYITVPKTDIESLKNNIAQVTQDLNALTINFDSLGLYVDEDGDICQRED